MRGSKPSNPLHQSDVDLLEFTDLIEAIGQGAKIEEGSPLSSLTAISFARIAESAVENNAGILRQGTVSEFRRSARVMLDSALAEECWLSGFRKGLEALFQTGDISAAVLESRLSAFPARYEELRRNAALHCSLILKKIDARRSRTGSRGRPKAAANGDALAKLLDSMILKDASLKARENSHDAISSAIPDVVREYMRLGQLRQLGGTEQESVDRHSRRLRALLDNLVRSPPTRGGFSIIRK
jgi:hypothetical protein